MEYWTNKVTLYSRCGDVYTRTAVLTGCFWKREDSALYEEGRRRTLYAFTARIPGATLIYPGDILALGDAGAECGSGFLKQHAGEAFRVSEVSINAAQPCHVRCGGENIA